MSTKRAADQAVIDLGNAIIDQHFPRLKEAGVRIHYQFASAKRNKDGQPRGPAIMHHGWPAAGKVRITSEEERVDGMGDALITLDGDNWEGWSEIRQRALIHHEIYHLELQFDKDGNLKLDDCFRPKLKIRPHDHQLGIFDSIIERYGAESIDAEMVERTFQGVQQWLFPEMRTKTAASGR